MVTSKLITILNRRSSTDNAAKIKEAHALLDRIEFILDSWITQLKQDGYGLG